MTVTMSLLRLQFRVGYDVKYYEHDICFIVTSECV